MNNNPTGIEERSIPLSILLTIITCGIYGLYWIYKLHDEANALAGRRDEMSPALVVVLCIVTCGIFQVYWAYTQGEKFREEAHSRGRSDADDLPVLYLVMEIANYFVGVTSIVNKALMQDRINQILRANGWGREPYADGRYTYRPAEEDIAREYEKAEAEYNADNPPAVPVVYGETAAPVVDATTEPSALVVDATTEPSAPVVEAAAETAAPVVDADIETARTADEMASEGSDDFEIS